MSRLDKGQDKEGKRKARSFNEKIKHLYRARFKKSLSSFTLGEDEERETKKLNRPHAHFCHPYTSAFFLSV